MRQGFSVSGAKWVCTSGGIFRQVGSACAGTGTQGVGPLDPAGTRGVAGTDHRAKAVHAHGLDSAELQNGLLHLPVAWLALHPAVVPGRRVHGHQQLRAAACQQAVPQGRLGAVFEGEAGQEDAVQKSLEQGRQASPPDGVDPHQVLCPGDVGLCGLQIGLQRLDALVPMVQDGIEGHVAQLQQAHFGTRLACRIGIGVGQGRTEAAGRGLSEDDEDAAGHGG